MGDSKHYETNPDDPNAPVVLHVYKGIRSGDRVKYVGTMPLDGEFRVDEIIQFANDDVMAIMHELGSADVYEVNADNLEKL